jgi:hypothetical protein
MGSRWPRSKFYRSSVWTILIKLKFFFWSPDPNKTVFNFAENVQILNFILHHPDFEVYEISIGEQLNGKFFNDVFIFLFPERKFLFGQIYLCFSLQ